jgi:hypothetical protein
MVSLTSRQVHRGCLLLAGHGDVEQLLGIEQMVVAVAAQVEPDQLIGPVKALSPSG